MASRRDDVVIHFRGDDKGVNQTLAQIRASVAGMSGMFKGAFAFAGISYGLDAIRDGILSTMAWADDLANAANRIGLTTGEVQALRNEMEHYGVSQQQADDALTKFSVNLGKARDGTGELYEIAKKYHMSLAGTGRDVLERYIQLIQSLNSEEERNRIISAAMGRGAIEAGQALAESGKKISEMYDIQREEGKIASQENIDAIAALEQYTTNSLQRAGVAWQNFFGTVIRKAGDFKTEIEESEAFRFWKWMLTGKAPDRPGIDKPKSEEEKPGGKKRDAMPGEIGPSEDMEKIVRERTRRASSAETAAHKDELKRRREASREHTLLELEIWRQYSAEKTALSWGDQQKAEAAQKAQEKALGQLVQAGASEAMVKVYSDIVGRIEGTPIDIKATMKIQPVGLEEMNAEIRTALEFGIIPLQVRPQLDFDKIHWTEGEDIDLPRDLPREVDKTGANP